MVVRALRALAGHARLVLPAGIVLGLMLPDLAARLNPLLPYAVCALLVHSMVRTDWPALRLTLRRPLVALAALAWLLLAMPLLVRLAADTLALPADLRNCLVLVAAMPPILSGPALASLLGLDAAAALVTVVAATLAVPLTLPGVAALAADADAAAPQALFLRLILVIVGALAAALLIRRLAGQRNLARHAQALDGAGLLLLLLFAVALMDGVGEAVAADPGRVALFTLAAFAGNLGMQAAGMIAFRPAGMQLAVTIGFLGGNRNAALLLATLPSPEPAFLLFVAVAQFPIYLLPSLLLPLYRRLAKA
jgi:bile acid:Na+ symporter, BASS family